MKNAMFGLVVLYYTFYFVVIHRFLVDQRRKYLIGLKLVVLNLIVILILILSFLAEDWDHISEDAKILI
jgi:hypothetical protein